MKRLNRHPIMTGLALVLLMLTGCAQHALQIRNAQDSFSQGAELELARKFDIAMPGIANPTEEAQRHYAIALGLVNEALRDGATDLKKDSLYGVALTIKALASWRLGDINTAQQAAKEVTAIAGSNAGQNRVWPRDRGICKALEALVKIDALATSTVAFEKTRDSDKQEKTLAEIISKGEKVQSEIESLGSDPDLDGHPFQIYLAQADCELAYVLFTATAAGVHFNTRVQPNLNHGKSYKQRYQEVRRRALDGLTAVSGKPGFEMFKMQTEAMKRYYSALIPKLE